MSETGQPDETLSKEEAAAVSIQRLARGQAVRRRLAADKAAREKEAANRAARAARIAARRRELALLSALPSDQLDSYLQFERSKAARTLQRFTRQKVLGDSRPSFGGVACAGPPAKPVGAAQSSGSAREGEEGGGAGSGRSLPPRYRRPATQVQGPIASGGRQEQGGDDAIWRGGDDGGDPDLHADGYLAMWPVDMLAMSDLQSRISSRATQQERGAHLAQLASLHSGLVSAGLGGAEGDALSVAGQARTLAGGADAEAADASMRAARVSALREAASTVYETQLGGSVHRPDLDVRRRRLVSRMHRHMDATTRPPALAEVLARGDVPSEEGGDSDAAQGGWSAQAAADATPWPPHPTLAAAGRAAHERAMKALAPDRPWWLVYTASALADLRKVRAPLPWRDWCPPGEHHPPSVGGSEGGEAAARQANQRRDNREEEVFGPPLHETQARQGEFTPRMASDIWLTYACGAFGGVGGASLAVPGDGGHTEHKDDGSQAPEAVSTFDRWAISTGMANLGVPDPWGEAPAATDALLADLEARGVRAVGRGAEAPPITDSVPSTREAVQGAEAALQQQQQQQQGDEAGDAAANASAHEHLDLALSLLEAPALDLPSGVGAAGALGCLAMPGTSISDRVKAAGEALRRHTRAAAVAREHSAHDRAVAARRIQQAWRARCVRAAARAEAARRRQARAKAQEAAKRAKWEEVYGRMSAMLREVVSDAVGWQPQETAPAGHRGTRHARPARHGSPQTSKDSDGSLWGLSPSPGRGAPMSRVAQPTPGSKPVSLEVSAVADSWEEGSEAPPTPPRDVPSSTLAASPPRRAGQAAGTTGGLTSTTGSRVGIHGFRQLPSTGLGASHDSGDSSPLAASWAAGGILRGLGDAPVRQSGASVSFASQHEASGVESAGAGAGRRRGRVSVDTSLGDVSSVSLGSSTASEVGAAIKSSMAFATPSARAAPAERFFDPGRVRATAKPGVSAAADGVHAAARAARAKAAAE